MPRYYQNPETGKWDLSQQEWEQLQAEKDKSNDEFAFSFGLMGNGFPSKDITMENRQKKALRKNPNHTTMKDYKFENPNSIPSKSLKKNKKRLAKKGIKVKDYGT